MAVSDIECSNASNLKHAVVLMFSHPQLPGLLNFLNQLLMYLLQAFQVTIEY
jgi:hypothetical protein